VASGTPAHVTYDAEGNPQARSLERVQRRSGSAALFKEGVLQDIIDQNPGMLPIRDFFPAANTVCSLRREISLELGEQVGQLHGRIDNLLVTDDGHLVLVETKLRHNPESTREVIAQVMEYAMAIGELALPQLEQTLRRGKRPRLGPGETIASLMQRAAAASSRGSVLDDFEDAFGRFRHTGELLVLIVTDEIRTSVERLSRWFGEKLGQGSPLRLGLVELQFYEDADGHVVVPISLLRTRELSRHVVVVDLKEAAASNVVVSVRDTEYGKSFTRQIRKPDTVLTKESFLERAKSVLPGEQFATVQTLVAGLDQLRLAKRGTPTTWQYGVKDATSFFMLATLSDRWVWCQIPVRLIAKLGPDRFNACKRILNEVGVTFYRPEDVEDADKVNALTPKYEKLVGKEQDFIRAIQRVAETATESIRETR